MPMSARSCASALPSRGKGCPSTVMVPLSIGSSRLIVRHKVDLPGAGRTDHDDDFAGGHDEVDVVQHVQRPEVLVHLVQHDQRPVDPIGDDQGLHRGCHDRKVAARGR